MTLQRRLMLRRLEPFDPKLQAVLIFYFAVGSFDSFPQFPGESTQFTSGSLFQDKGRKDKIDSLQLYQGDGTS